MEIPGRVLVKSYLEEMKITEIKSYNFSSVFAAKNTFGNSKGLKNISLITVKTKCGLEGIGETYVGIYIPELILPVINELKQFLVGKNPEEIVKTKIHIPFVSRNGIFKSIYSAVDIAMWDLIAKKHKKPLHKILCKNNNKYKIYSSGGLVNSNTSQLNEEINRAKKIGHQGFKMRIGKKKWDIDYSRIKFALNLTQKFKLNLMVDSIMGTINPPWTFKNDLFKIKDLSQKVYWLEEPFHPDNYEDYKKLVKNKIVTVATGEALSGELDYKSYLYNKLCNFIQIDVTNCGGITDAINILKIAKSKNIKIAMHVWGSKVASMANAHFAYAFPEVKWLEYPLMQPEINQYIYSELKNHLHLNFYKNKKYFGLGLRYNVKILNSKFKYINESKYRI